MRSCGSCGPRYCTHMRVEEHFAYFKKTNLLNEGEERLVEWGGSDSLSGGGVTH